MSLKVGSTDGPQSPGADQRDSAGLPTPPRRRKLFSASILIGAILMLGLAQIPGYYRTTARYNKAQSLFDSGRYEEAIEELDVIRKSGTSSPKIEYLYGKASLVIGNTREADMIIKPLKLDRDQEAELSAVANQVVAAKPHWLAARERMYKGDSGAESRALLDKAIEAWPTFVAARAVRASAYGALYTKTLDESWAVKYRDELASVRRMCPSAARQLDKSFGDLEKYKPATMHFVAGQKLMGQHAVEEAISEYWRAIEIYPGHSRAHAYLAVAYARKYEQTGDKRFKEQCIREYRYAVRLNSKRAGVKPLLGALANEVDAR